MHGPLVVIVIINTTPIVDVVLIVGITRMVLRIKTVNRVKLLSVKNVRKPVTITFTQRRNNMETPNLRAVLTSFNTVPDAHSFITKEEAVEMEVKAINEYHALHARIKVLEKRNDVLEGFVESARDYLPGIDFLEDGEEDEI